MHYYQRLIDIGKLKHGQYYSSLSDSFIIFICTFDRFNAGILFILFAKLAWNVRLSDLTMPLPKSFYALKVLLTTFPLTLRLFLITSIAALSPVILCRNLIPLKSNRKAMKKFITYEMSLLERELNSEQLGLLQGRNQEKESVALKMLHKGSSIDNIHDLTDFPLERIKPLASNIFS